MINITLDVSISPANSVDSIGEAKYELERAMLVSSIFNKLLENSRLFGLNDGSRKALAGYLSFSLPQVRNGLIDFILRKEKEERQYIRSRELIEEAKKSANIE